METKKNVLKQIIYDTYVAFFNEFKDTNKAYQKTISTLQSLLKNSNYSAFPSVANIQQTLMENFSNPEDCTKIILDDVIDTIIQNQDSNLTDLANAIIVTNNSHGKKQVIVALNDVIKIGDYNRFSRYYGESRRINYRDTLQKSFSPQDISNIITGTITNSIIAEKQSENATYRIGTQYANQISNLQINSSIFNQCRQDILEGKQIRNKRSDYSLENMYASIDFGNNRQNQEDSVIILNHPLNPNFKMLVVADGMGGMADGEKVSSYITSCITRWFESINSEYFMTQNLNALKQCFEQEIQNINQMLYATYKGNSSSTFVGAIVTEKETIISHVGDSRAYIYSQGKLHQLTEDDSLCYSYWKNGMIQQKDDIRFHKDSNKTTKGMGLSENVVPTTSIISNSDYDTLLLFSDGITDCLSDSQIMVITSTTPTKDLAKTLVDNAKATDSMQTHLNPNEYYNFIEGGKDNTTAAVYDNHVNNPRNEER